MAGKTHSRFLTPEQAGLVRQQIDAGRQFRARVDDYWEACEEWADRQLADLTASTEEAKKGGSKRTSKTKSPGKSKRSKALRPSTIWISRPWRSRHDGRLYGWRREPWNNG